MNLQLIKIEEFLDQLSDHQFSRRTMFYGATGVTIPRETIPKIGLSNFMVDIQQRQGYL
jgi:hypothetical protein